MENDLYQFTWDVSVDGHEWLDFEFPNHPKKDTVTVPHITDNYVHMHSYEPKAESRGKRPLNDEDLQKEDSYLIRELEKRNKERKVIRYSPLTKYPDLYQEFAKTPTTQEGVLAFANKYGLLSRTQDIFSRNLQRVKVTKTAGYMTYAESVHDWYKEIQAMQYCLELWNCLRLGKNDKLARRIYWTDDGSVGYKSYDGDEMPQDGVFSSSWIAIKGNPSDAYKLDKLKRGELERPAFMYLQIQINKKLKDRLSPQLLWDRHWTELGLHILPHDLIGALWLQLAQAITHQKTVKVCEVCGKPIIVANTYGTRSDRQYCSGACRSKAYRDRKKRK